VSLVVKRRRRVVTCGAPPPLPLLGGWVGRRWLFGIIKATRVLSIPWHLDNAGERFAPRLEVCRMSLFIKEYI
jgi:hypothetical protein